MYSPEQSAAARHAADLVAKREYDPTRYPDLIEVLVIQLDGAEKLIAGYNRSMRDLARSQRFSIHGRVFEFKGEEPEAPELPPEKPSEAQQRFERHNTALRPGRERLAQRRATEFEPWLVEHQSEELKAKREQLAQLQAEVRELTVDLKRQFNNEVLGVYTPNNP